MAIDVLKQHVPGVRENGIVTDATFTLTGTVDLSGSTLTQPTSVTTAGVGAAGGFSVSPRNFHSGGAPAVAAADGTNTDVVTTETYISEVFVPANCTITGIAVFNGGAVAGNLTVGLATSAGAPIAAAKSASTAQSGTDGYQRIDFATPYAAKGPATYYIMVQGNNTGADLNTHTVGNFNAQKQTGQTYGTFATITVAGTFTTAVGVIASLY